MNYVISILLACMTFGAIAEPAADDKLLQLQMTRLHEQAMALQAQVDSLQKKLLEADASKHIQLASNGKVSALGTKPETPALTTSTSKGTKRAPKKPVLKKPLQADDSNVQALSTLSPMFQDSPVTVHTAVDADPESIDFYPTALVASNHVLTYIAGTPVVSSPYLGNRPAFDGSDYIVNISSINRDIRLMQQRRSLGRAYVKMGYPIPNRPILALSGAVVPNGSIGQPYFGATSADWNLGSDELDIAAILNNKVEAYMALAYNAAPPTGSGQRVANSNLSLNMGFINIGDLDRSPLYLTAGQLFAPFGRFSTSMVSPTLPLLITRTKARPFILGYKSQQDSGLFAALYGYRGDTTLGSTGVGGANLGYILDAFHSTSELGVSYITSMNDAGGMQNTGSPNGTTFGGFGSYTNGNENVKKVSGFGVHYAVSFDRYNITTEWVTSLGRFRESDLSFNGQGAQPQAMQLEGGVTFVSFTRPSSVAASFQWTKDALALNIPRQRINAVYNISIWKDTVESLEYRHDIDYGNMDYGNGAAPSGVTNENTYGTGSSADTVMLQLAIYF